MTAVRSVVGLVSAAVICPESLVSEDNDLHCKRQPPSTPTTTTQPCLFTLFQKVRTFMIILNSKLASIKSSDSGVSVKPSCFINGVLPQSRLDPFSVSGLAGSCACRHVEHHVLCSYLVVGVLLHPTVFGCVFQGECDQSFGADFEFEVHSKELIVGEIFVRIYNEQPTFPLEVSGLYIMD